MIAGKKSGKGIKALGEVSNKSLLAFSIIDVLNCGAVYEKAQGEIAGKREGNQGSCGIRGRAEENQDAEVGNDRAEHALKDDVLHAVSGRRALEDTHMEFS